MKSLVLLSVLSLSGCGTLASAPHSGFGPYSGTRAILQALGSGPLEPAHLLLLLDLPFSFVADTLLLPVGISAVCRRRAGR